MVLSKRTTFSFYRYSICTYNSTIYIGTRKKKYQAIIVQFNTAYNKIHIQYNVYTLRKPIEKKTPSVISLIFTGI